MPRYRDDDDRCASRHVDDLTANDGPSDDIGADYSASHNPSATNMRGPVLRCLWIGDRSVLRERTLLQRGRLRKLHDDHQLLLLHDRGK